MPRKKPAASALDAHLGFWLRFVSNHVSGEFEKAMASHGVSVTEWVALRTMYDTPGSSHASLMEALGMTKGAVSKVVSRLQDKDLVSRGADTGLARPQARPQLLALTAVGRALVPTLAASADANDARFFGHLTAAQRHELRALLEQMVRHHGLKDVPLA